MSWLSGIAKGAEELLNKVDQKTASALHTPVQHGASVAVPRIGELDAMNAGPRIPHLAAVPPPPPPVDFTQAVGSVPSRSLIDSPKQRAAGKSRRAQDKDEQLLFEFLNSDEPAGPAKIRTAQVNGHSRKSSTSSVSSHRSGYVETASMPSGMETSQEGSQIAESVTKLSSAEHDVSIMISEDGSMQQSSAVDQSQKLSSLELENQLLRNEVASLNQEITSALRRAKEAEDEFASGRAKLQQWSAQRSRAEQELVEATSRVSDLGEALQAKDSQLAVLRVRLQEADAELQGKRKHCDQLQTERERILRDHTDSSGAHGYALDSLREKLQETEVALKREQEAYHKLQDESMDKQNRMLSEQQYMASNLAEAERKLSEEKAKQEEFGRELKSAKKLAGTARQDLADYKQKAQRILQSKEKLIAGLKETSSSADGATAVIAAAELEETRQERDGLREEVQKLGMTIETLRADMQELEGQLHQDSECSQEQLRQLEEELCGERRARREADQEVVRGGEELRFAQEDLRKHKLLMHSRLQDRDKEIERLRNQLTTKAASTSSESELEARLHALTESLIQKQTLLEALSTEKNSIRLQLERTEVRAGSCPTTDIRHLEGTVQGG
ncbi:PREDICTED: golgin subfamily A member 5-like isoform X2 [Priapulus caudatus]|uniref:Golgin subfamily A member 5-like isoform X2 n=1 Tax=Priapulus caudatus TaxID=37621 RepID=A0ABM1FBE2_PRICU|nr:PREDICTED: golgin subfamily A member 5-like isoform X2 [Priapulus caudatus]